jgi:hypothetical protein
MANSGTVTTSPGLTSGGLVGAFSWSTSNINADKGTATVNWSWYVSGNSNKIWSLIYGDTGSNYLTVAGVSKWSLNGYHYKDGYPASYGSTAHFSNGVIKTDQDWCPYTYVYASLASGSFTIYYSEDGNASFTVSGAICCFNNNTVSRLSTTIYLDKIDRFNKSKKTANFGSSWGNANFWKTVDGGRTWSKCNGYKTTNYGSSWSKL